MSAAPSTRMRRTFAVSHAPTHLGRCPFPSKGFHPRIARPKAGVRRRQGSQKYARTPALIPKLVSFAEPSVVVVTPVMLLVDWFLLLPVMGKSSMGPTVMPTCGNGVMMSSGSRLRPRPSALFEVVAVPFAFVPLVWNQ